MDRERTALLPVVLGHAAVGLHTQLSSMLAAFSLSSSSECMF